MAYRIKTITDADKPRAYITFEETDAQGDPIPGRKWTLNFDTQKKDWAGLKKRLEDEVKDADDKATAVTNLITEGNNAGVADIS